MSSATRSTRSALPALVPAGGLLLAGCGGGGDPAAEGHDHASSSAPATVSGADDAYAGLHLQDPYRKPAFTLTDTTGAPFDFAARTTGPTLLFFGYTHCPDVCPTTMADIAVGLRQVDPAVAARTSVVFVTTDPARDTPQVLGEYLDRFDADLPTQFVGLTGEQDTIDQAQLAAGVPLAEDRGRQHSSLLLLYGADDEAPVAFDTGNTPQDIAGDLGLVTGT